MTKLAFLHKITQIRIKAENEEPSEEIKLLIIDLLLDYNGDADVRKAIEEVPM